MWRSIYISLLRSSSITAQLRSPFRKATSRSEESIRYKRAEWKSRAGCRGTDTATPLSIFSPQKHDHYCRSPPVQTHIPPTHSLYDGYIACFLIATYTFPDDAQDKSLLFKRVIYRPLFSVPQKTRCSARLRRAARRTYPFPV